MLGIRFKKRKIIILDSLLILSCLSILAYIVAFIIVFAHFQSLAGRTPSEDVFREAQRFINVLMKTVVFPIGFSLSFSILLLIDCIKRAFSAKRMKINWIVVIIFGNILGAIIYYLRIVRKEAS